MFAGIWKFVEHEKKKKNSFYPKCLKLDRGLFLRYVNLHSLTCGSVVQSQFPLSTPQIATDGEVRE